MGNHDHIIRAELLLVVDSHDALKLLTVILGLVSFSNGKIFGEVKHHNLLHIVPLAGHEEGVRVVVDLVRGLHVAVLDLVVHPLVDLNHFSLTDLQIHEKNLGATPADHELFTDIKRDFFDEG